MKRLI